VNFTTRSWEGRVMGTEARLLVVTDDPKAGDEALVRAAEDLEATEEALSRFREHSELSRLKPFGGGGRRQTPPDRPPGGHPGVRVVRWAAGSPRDLAAREAWLQGRPPQR
jgi:hypothetical protein